MEGQGKNQQQILEELQEQKRLLGGANSIPLAAKTRQAQPTGGNLPTKHMIDPNSLPNLQPSQRATLTNALQGSPAYFIYQDSAHGNSILPVVPRFAESQ